MPVEELESRTQIGRWVPAGAMLAVSLISYIDRNTLALLAPTILRETGLSGEQYGFIISAFSIAYMLANPVWGKILDRAGLRRGMTVAVSCWTVASVAHAFAGGLWSFAAARAALGFGEGATFPGGLRTVVQTLPEHQRGRGLAVAYSGGSLGAVVTPADRDADLPVVGLARRLLVHRTGRARVAGIVGRGFETPGDPPRAAGRRVEDPRTASAATGACGRSSAPTPWARCRSGLCSTVRRSIWRIPSARTQAFIGKVLWIPPLGWEVGYFVWGWLTDRGLRQAGSRRAGLRRMLAWCARTESRLRGHAAGAGDFSGPAADVPRHVCGLRIRGAFGGVRQQRLHFRSRGSDRRGGRRFLERRRGDCNALLRPIIRRALVRRGILDRHRDPDVRIHRMAGAQ